MSKISKKERKERLGIVLDLYAEGNNVTQSTMKMCEKLVIKYNETMGRYYTKQLQKLGVTQNVKRLEDTEEFKKAQTFKKDSGRDFYIITWGQSQTKVFMPYWENLIAFKDYLNAGLHVIAGRYRNPTSLEASARTKGEEFRDSNITPYLDANRQELTKKLLVLSDVKVQPTAKTPLSGMSSFVGECSAILGHPSIHLEPLPVLEGESEKVIQTTGACTVPNYTDTKAGKWAEEHHEYGFVLVEIDGDQFNIRQIQADENGTFYDLDLKVENGKVFKHGEKLPLSIFGDLHYGISHCEESVRVAEELSMKLNVQEVAVHDVFDGFTINPHEANNPFVQLNLESYTLAGEIEATKDKIRDLATKFKHVYSVNSNHNDFLDRWLISNDWRKNRHKKEYLDLVRLKADNPDDTKGVFHLLVDEMGLANVTTLGHSESHKIKGWEIAMHYDRGASGSRGSINQFKNLGIKSIGGHGHTPKRAGNAIMVGTLTKKRIGYNKGLSPWVNGIVLVYPNGKAHHIHIINGKYTTRDI